MRLPGFFPGRRKVEVNYSNRSGIVEKVQRPSSTWALRRQVPDTLHVLAVEDNLINQRVLANSFAIWGVLCMSQIMYYDRREI